MTEKIPSVRESLESLMPKGKDEQADKKLFFVICNNCGAKIFAHNGYIEAKGLFTFAVECPCGNKFNHKLMLYHPQGIFKNLTKKLMGAGE